MHSRKRASQGASRLAGAAAAPAAAAVEDEEEEDGEGKVETEPDADAKADARAERKRAKRARKSLLAAAAATDAAAAAARAAEIARAYDESGRRAYPRGDPLVELPRARNDAPLDLSEWGIFPAESAAAGSVGGACAYKPVPGFSTELLPLAPMLQYVPGEGHCVDAAALARLRAGGPRAQLALVQRALEGYPANEVGVADAARVYHDWIAPATSSAIIGAVSACDYSAVYARYWARVDVLCRVEATMGRVMEPSRAAVRKLVLALSEANKALCVVATFHAQSLAQGPVGGKA